MSAIFETEFRDLPDEEGNITKGSTAKLVLLALADHANDEGEGAYPGLTKMERKTALSRQTIINTYGSLKYNGVIYLVGTSRKNTNNYTINTASFPKATADSQPILLVNPLDQSTHLTSTSQATLPEVVNPLDPNHPLIIQEPSIDIIQPARQEPDKIAEWLKMGQFAGAKRETRIDAILSYLGERFHVNTEVKKWKDFAKFVETRQTYHGEQVDIFVSWLLGQKDFNLQYWPPSKMQEFWPMAFVKVEDKSRTEGQSSGYFA